MSSDRKGLAGIKNRENLRFFDVTHAQEVGALPDPSGFLLTDKTLPDFTATRRCRIADCN
jgi:hypothetical protein